jgi:hypothetical protein
MSVLYQDGKVRKVEEWLAARGRTLADTITTFYSDSINDLPLLEKVTHPVVTNGDARLRAVALERGWPTLQLFEPACLVAGRASHDQARHRARLYVVHAQVAQTTRAAAGVSCRSAASTLRLVARSALRVCETLRKPVTVPIWSVVRCVTCCSASRPRTSTSRPMRHPSR